jgi:hypothetical protein
LPSAALVDFPLLVGARFYISIMQRIKRELEFLSDAKKGSRGLKPGSGADRNKLGLPIGELCVVNPFFVGCMVALEIELDCHVQLVHAGGS